jgi:hypothetical protein
MVIHGNVTIGNTFTSKIKQNCADSYLQVRLDDRVGTLVHGSKGSPRRFRFYIGNPTKDCTAIVKSLYVKVLDTVPDNHPFMEALTAKFKYKIHVSKADVGKSLLITDDSFNYAPASAPDQFVIDVFRKDAGVDYALRFSVRWFDLKTNAENWGKSWVALAPFPAGQGDLFGSVNDALKWRQDQLAAFRTKYYQKADAIKDAAEEDPPYALELDNGCTLENPCQEEQ